MTQFPPGDTAVSVSTEEGAGNKTDCSFAVKVHDTTPSTLVVPADLAVDATSAEGAVVVHPTATATALGTPSPVIVFEPTSGVQLPLGKDHGHGDRHRCVGEHRDGDVPRHCRRHDRAADPVLANVEVIAEGESGATVTLPSPALLDAVTAAPTVTFDHAQQGTYQVGSTKVVATATDAAGNSATRDFEVKVSAVFPSAVVREGGCSSTSGTTLGGLVVLGLALMRRRRLEVSGFSACRFGSPRLCPTHRLDSTAWAWCKGCRKP
jgi:uncharacterized protein (TIGR03382 family)